MLTRDEIVKTLRDHRTEWAEFDVESISLFGSMARDEATAESDIDVLVDFRSAPTFDSYMGLKIYLEDLFGRRVDLATRKTLKPRIREIVEREALRVA
jgi:predicted nucleotidyltransferase